MSGYDWLVLAMYVNGCCLANAYFNLAAAVTDDSPRHWKNDAYFLFFVVLWPIAALFQNIVSLAGKPEK